MQLINSYSSEQHYLFGRENDGAIRKGKKGLLELYHITFLEQPKQNVLRVSIPDETTLGEDYETKRISLAPSIIDCIRGIYKHELFYDQVVFIRAYKVIIGEDDENLIEWKELYQSDKVRDAALTHEYWYLKNLEPVEYYEYVVTDCHEKKYLIISADYKDKIIDSLNETGVDKSLIPPEMNAFQLLNKWIPEQSKEIRTNLMEKMQHKVTDESFFDVDDPAIMAAMEELFGEPQPYSYYKNDYDEKTYIDSCLLTKVR